MCAKHLPRVVIFVRRECFDQPNYFSERNHSRHGFRVIIFDRVDGPFLLCSMWLREQLIIEKWQRGIFKVIIFGKVNSVCVCVCVFFFGSVVLQSAINRPMVSICIHKLNGIKCGSKCLWRSSTCCLNTYARISSANHSYRAPLFFYRFSFERWRTHAPSCGPPRHTATATCYCPICIFSVVTFVPLCVV